MLGQTGCDTGRDPRSGGRVYLEWAIVVAASVVGRRETAKEDGGEGLAQMRSVCGLARLLAAPPAAPVAAGCYE